MLFCLLEKSFLQNSCVHQKLFVNLQVRKWAAPRHSLAGLNLCARFAPLLQSDNWSIDCGP